MEKIKIWIEENRKKSVIIIVAALLVILCCIVGVAYAMGNDDEPKKEGITADETLDPPLISLYGEKVYTGVNTPVSLQEKVVESIFAEAGLKDVTVEPENETQASSIVIAEEEGGEEVNGVPAVTVTFTAEGEYTLIITASDNADGKTALPVVFKVGNTALSYIQGIREWSVEQGTAEVNFMDGITWDTEYIASIEADTSQVDLDTPGTYQVVYHIVTTDMLGGGTVDGTAEITVLSSEKAQEAADAGKQVQTTDGVKKNSSGNTPTGTVTSQTSDKATVTAPTQKPTQPANTSGDKKEPEQPKHTHNYNIPIKETVYHEAETHTEKKWVVDKEAWTETVNHPEEGHYEKIKVKDAWDEQIPIYEQQIQYKCKVCGIHTTTNAEASAHSKQHALAGEGGGWYDDPVQVQVGTQTVHHDAEYEDKWVVDKAAWTETVNHPEEGHYENTTIVDKAAWNEEKTVGYKCACGAVK